MREQVKLPEGKSQNGLMGKSWSSLFTLTKSLTFLDTMEKKIPGERGKKTYSYSFHDTNKNKQHY